jgi:membrane-associated phospholipid phosphatase
MTQQATDSSVGATTTVSSRRGTFVEARSTVARLLVAAAVLWGVLCGVGYLLTHHLKDTSFERWDAAANRRLTQHRTDMWNTVTHWLTYCAETLTVIAIGVVFFVGLRVALGRWRESVFLAAALAGEVTIFVLTTLMIDRDRPPVSHLDSAPPTSSFPSGHTAAAVALYVGLAIIAFHVSRRPWLRTLALIVAVAMPACVAFARLYRGMHFVTDVLGGALLSLAWLTVTWALILRAGNGDRADPAPWRSPTE